MWISSVDYAPMTDYNYSPPRQRTFLTIQGNIKPDYGKKTAREVRESICSRYEEIIAGLESCGVIFVYMPELELRGQPRRDVFGMIEGRIKIELVG